MRTRFAFCFLRSGNLSHPALEIVVGEGRRCLLFWPHTFPSANLDESEVGKVYH